MRSAIDPMVGLVSEYPMLSMLKTTCINIIEFHLIVIISVPLILERTHVKEIQEVLFPLQKMEGLNQTQ